MKELVKSREIFSTLLKDAKVKKYAEGKLTLMFSSDYKKRHFLAKYKSEFENIASKLFGENFSVEGVI